MTEEGLRLLEERLVIVNLARAWQLATEPATATYLKALRLRPVAVQLLALS
jgi:hypothetical protein